MARGGVGKDDAHMMINSLLADIWPTMGQQLLGEIKKEPILIDPYLLKLKSGKLRYAPSIHDIKMMKPLADVNQQSRSTDTTDLTVVPSTRKRPPEKPPSPWFQCTVKYRGYPDIELVLSGAEKKQPNKPVKTSRGAAVKRFFMRVSRRLVPDVLVDVNSVYLVARIEVKLDMRERTVSFFFVDRPSVQWDVDLSVKRPLWEIPIPLVNRFDSVVSRALCRHDSDQPISVKF